MTKVSLTDGSDYDVKAEFGPTRALIDYGGLFTFVDRRSDGKWDLSGLPPQNEVEHDALAKAIAPMQDKSILTVTKPDGSPA